MNDPEEPLNSVSYIDRLSRWGLSIVRVQWTGLNAGFSPVYSLSEIVKVAMAKINDCRGKG